MTRLDEMSGTTRLTEFLAVDHAKLQHYIGAAAFTAIGRRYAMKYPLLDPSVRWFSRNLAKFLGETMPYSKNPELAELARLEAALNTAFEAPDASILSVSELAGFEAKGLGNCMVVVHPSVQRLCLLTNTTSLWAALQCDEPPPRPERLDVPQELLVWRQGTNPRFRMLGKEEALTLDLALQGNPFAKICEALAQASGGEVSAECADTYLRGWVEAELVSAIRYVKEAA
jgi:hypothetical protein